MTPILSVCCIWILIVFLEELQSMFFFYIYIYTPVCIFCCSLIEPAGK